MARLTVLVTGATGAQGGAIARRLLQRGHRVRALTRRPGAPPSRALTALGATLFTGDLEDQQSLERALAGVDAVFALSTPFEGGPPIELRQGRTLAAAARTVGVGHYVYASSAGAGAPSAVPHFESKRAVERHLETLPWTVLAPVFFMDNLVSPWWLPALCEGQLQWPLPGSCAVQVVSLDDYADLAVVALEQPARVLRQRLVIAADAVTGEEMADALARAAHRPIRFEEQPRAAVAAVSEDVAALFAWLEAVGFSGDPAAVRAAFPEVRLRLFEEWARDQPWPSLLARRDAP